MVCDVFLPQVCFLLVFLAAFFKLFTNEGKELLFKTIFLLPKNFHLSSSAEAQARQITLPELLSHTHKNTAYRYCSEHNNAMLASITAHDGVLNRTETSRIGRHWAQQDVIEKEWFLRHNTILDTEHVGRERPVLPKNQCKLDS